MFVLDIYEWGNSLVTLQPANTLQRWWWHIQTITFPHLATSPRTPAQTRGGPPCGPASQPGSHSLTLTSHSLSDQTPKVLFTQVTPVRWWVGDHLEVVTLNPLVSSCQKYKIIRRIQDLIILKHEIEVPEIKLPEIKVPEIKLPEINDSVGWLRNTCLFQLLN